MKQLVFALIRRRIRALYPEPILISVLKQRGVQAGAITLFLYTLIFALFARIDIQPSRTVELYATIAVTILPTTEVEIPEPEPVAALSDAPADAVRSSGDGIFSPNRGPGLERVESGESNIEVETPQVEDAPPPGDNAESTEGLRESLAKPKIAKVHIAAVEPDPKKETEKQQAIKPIREPPEEIVPDPTEDSVVIKEPDKSLLEHDAKPEIDLGHSNIMPAYVVDRGPQVKRLGIDEFPQGYDDQILEFTVLLRIILGADGKVIHVETIDSAGRDFDEAAIKLLLSTEFQPAYVGSLAVPSLVEVSVDFRSRYEESE